MGEQSLLINNKISIFTKYYNYYAKTGMGNKKQKIRNGKAVKLLSDLTENEMEIILNNKEVQEVIFRIDNQDILRTIFRKVPSFFQEIMFNNENIQDILLSPRPTLKRKELFDNYNKKDIVFSSEQLRELENFLHTVKSPIIYDQIIENKFFQRIIALCYDKQLKKSFFKGMNVEKLFYNIINDDAIYNTRIFRKRNILNIFNNVSNHILLSNDYNKVINNTRDFIKSKEWRFKNDEQVIVDENTLSLMSTEMIEILLNFKNIDTNIIVNYLKKGIINNLEKNNYDFDKIFSHLLQREYSRFNRIDFVYMNIILDECEKDDKIKNNFINILYKILCHDSNCNQDEKRIIKNAIYNQLKSKKMSKEFYQHIFYSPNVLKTIFFLKFGKVSYRMDYLNGISYKQIMLLNVKHINQILGLLEIDNEDELSNLYAYAIKLYLVFGLERSLKLLNQEYGRLNRVFFDNISKLQIDKVSFKKEGSKYLPIISKDFINFMFSNEKSNHFINMLNDNNCDLYKYWSYLYNNFDDLKEKCHGVVTLKKLNIIFKQLSPSRDINVVTPDNYRLKEKDILNDICLGNKTSKSNGEVYKSVLDIYEKMKKRTESSIPYVKGDSKNGYSYEMMKLNDPIAFTLGYKGNCCIRTCDIAHNHLLHATLCRNGRILIIYNDKDEIAAFSPLKRNGEVLIANSIECTHKTKDEKAIETFSEAIKEIVAVSQNNSSDKNPINLVCIGADSYAKPSGIPFPKNILTPTIYEKKDFIYRETDQYHTRLSIVYKNPDLELFSIKYGNPEVSYLDPRNQICSCDFIKSTKEEINEVLNVINAVRYANSDLEELDNFQLCNGYGISNCIYNNDWYILKTFDGSIYGEYLNYDDRAKSEYNISLEEFKNHYCNTQQKSINVKRLK